MNDGLPQFLKFPDGSWTRLPQGGGPYQPTHGDQLRFYHYVAGSGGVPHRVVAVSESNDVIRARPYTLVRDISAGGWRMTGQPYAVLWSADDPDENDLHFVRAQVGR